MKLSLKQIIAGSLLAAAASSPAFAFDAANVVANQGNGSLIVTAFDADAGKSVVVDLGLNYIDFLNSATSRDGRAGTDVTSDAGNTLSWSIDLSVFGGNLSNVQWNVFAADGQGNAATTETLVTAALNQGTIPGLNGDVAAMSGPGAYGNIVNQCNGAGMSSVCTGADAASSTYFGGSDWGTNFQFMDVSGSATLGTALGFYGVTRSSAVSSGAMGSYQYANSAGVVAQWLLNADGSLSYISAAVGGSTVPVPAAIWLLLSGLGGLGVIGRRRQVAA